MKTIEGHNVKIFTNNIEGKALAQIRRLLDINVFADCRVRIMPDVHAGAGCVIGFTGDLGCRVIPNIVGVDIGCGMRVLPFRMKSRPDWHSFQRYIEQNIPAGFDVRRQPELNLQGNDLDTYSQARELVDSLLCRKHLKYVTRQIYPAIGSLGGGNHFIEIDRDDQGIYYLVVHTGSRNLGSQVAEHYQDRAVIAVSGWADFEERRKSIISTLKAEGREREIQSRLRRLQADFQAAVPDVPSELCWLEGEGREAYLHDMRICQQWAVLNRGLIVAELARYLRLAGAQTDDEAMFETVHNYIGEDNIIRKGAISAREGERCLIPLNMRDGSLICTGRGNPDWNYSAPHGAGRIMSRSQAYREVNLGEFRKSMAGIYSETVNDFTRDESPMVYKPADEIIRNIHPTVDIERAIKPVFNFKASK